LNPIEWPAALAEERHRAKAAYEAKERCRCEHFNKITRVKPASAAEVRAFKKGAPHGND
jgi:hypothetical protein